MSVFGVYHNTFGQCLFENSAVAGIVVEIKQKDFQIGKSNILCSAMFYIPRYALDNALDK